MVEIHAITTEMHLGLKERIKDRDLKAQQLCNRKENNSDRTDNNETEDLSVFDSISAGPELN